MPTIVPVRSGLILNPVQPTARLGNVVDYVLNASDVGSGVVSLSCVPISIPVISIMTASRIAVSWLSDNIPSGDWAATLERKPVGGVWSSVSTFAVSTS